MTPTHQKAEHKHTPEYEALLNAVKATYAWFYCESKSIGGQDARSELCNYSEYLCERAFGLTHEQYKGVPRLYLHGLERADEANCERLIDEAFAHIMQSATNGGGNG